LTPFVAAPPTGMTLTAMPPAVTIPPEMLIAITQCRSSALMISAGVASGFRRRTG
jgi:hypothetical protein